VKQIRKHAEGKGLKVGGREKLGIWTGGELAVIKNAAAPAAQVVAS